MRLSEVNIKEGYPFEHHGKALRLHEPQRFLFLPYVYKSFVSESVSMKYDIYTRLIIEREVLK